MSGALQRANALYVLTDHRHGARPSKLVRDNCGACALAGHGADERGIPNHSNWMRLYVQGRVAVDKVQRDAILDAVAKGDVYGRALAEDIATHGLWLVEVAE